jgi:hypothetical protein
MSIETFLSTSTPTSTEPQPTAEIIEPTAEATADENDVTAASNVNREIAGLRKGMLTEREKRQRAEAERDELKRLVGQRAEQPKEPERDPYESVLEDLPGGFRTAEQRFQKRLKEQAYAQSEEIAKTLHNDYLETLEHYQDAVKHNPYLPQLVDNSPVPAIAAYRAIKDYIAAKQSDPKEIAAKATAEAAAKIQALEQEVASLRSTYAASTVPSTLSNARGSGAATAPPNSWSGPTPMHEILRRR